MYIKEGYQTSFHYHKKKDETMYIISGAGYIEFEDHKEYFNKNDTLLATAGGKYLDRTLQSAPSFPTVVFLTITCLSSRRIRA